MGGLLGGLSKSAGPSQLNSWPLLLLEVQPNLPHPHFHDPDKDTWEGDGADLHWFPAQGVWPGGTCPRLQTQVPAFMPAPKLPHLCPPYLQYSMLTQVQSGNLAF